MKKEDLIAMGLTEDQADKVVASFGQTIPKARFDEVNEAKKQLETDLAARDTQLEDLKKTAGASEDLKAQIATLQAANETSKTEYEAKLKDTQLNSALKLALAGKVHDLDYAITQIDKEKIELDADGNVTKGLDEQVTPLRETKSFLFVPEKKEQSPKFKGWNPAGSEGGAGNELDTGSAFAKQFNEKGAVGSDTPNPWG